MSTNQSQPQRSEVPKDIPNSSDKSDGAPASAPFTPKWWRDDKHGAAWERSKQSVRASWGQSATAQIDPRNRDTSLGERLPSGQRMAQPATTEGAGQPKAGLDPSNIAQARTLTPEPKLNPSHGATQASDPELAQGAGRRDLRDDDLRLGGDEEALRYGVGAREEYGASHPTWNPALEKTLQADWQSDFDGVKQPDARRQWSQVEKQVRHGYEHPRDSDSKPRA